MDQAPLRGAEEGGLKDRRGFGRGIWAVPTPNLWRPVVPLKGDKGGEGGGDRTIWRADPSEPRRPRGTRSRRAHGDPTCPPPLDPTPKDSYFRELREADRAHGEKARAPGGSLSLQPFAGLRRPLPTLSRQLPLPPCALALFSHLDARRLRQSHVSQRPRPPSPGRGRNHRWQRLPARSVDRPQGSDVAPACEADSLQRFPVRRKDPEGVCSSEPWPSHPCS